ncbi:hypothetical protein ACJX0J_033817, partial [Zea mays]
MNNTISLATILKERRQTALYEKGVQMQRIIRLQGLDLRDGQHRYSENSEVSEEFCTMFIMFIFFLQKYWIYLFPTDTATRSCCTYSPMILLFWPASKEHDP